jgi:hypothetical protein
VTVCSGAGFVIDCLRDGWFDDVCGLAKSFGSFREKRCMSFEEALEIASRDEGFKATVYAMNTLLIRKGVYTQEEFQLFFVEWVEKEVKREGKSALLSA